MASSSELLSDYDWSWMCMCVKRVAKEERKGGGGRGEGKFQLAKNIGTLHHFSLPLFLMI